MHEDHVLGSEIIDIKLTFVELRVWQIFSKIIFQLNNFPTHWLRGSSLVDTPRAAVSSCFKLVLLILAAFRARFFLAIIFFEIVRVYPRNFRVGLRLGVNPIRCFSL